jgi:hypothetical protein
MKTFNITSAQMLILIIDMNFNEPSVDDTLKEIGVIIPASDASIDQIFNGDNEDFAFFKSKEGGVVHFTPDEEGIEDMFCIWEAGAWHDSDPTPIIEGQTWPEIKFWLIENCD